MFYQASDNFSPKKKKIVKFNKKKLLHGNKLRLIDVFSLLKINYQAYEPLFHQKFVEINNNNLLSVNMLRLNVDFFFH